MASLLIIFVGALVAFCISVLAGGGAGLVLLPLLGLALPPASVPGALSIGTAVSAASRLAAFRKAVRWDIARVFVPAAIPFAVLGAWLMTRLPSSYLELCLGCFLLGNVIFVWRRERRHVAGTPVAAAVARPKVFLVIIGILAGFVSGFTGAVGVLFNDVYLCLGLRKEEIVATRAANEIVLHLVKILVYALLGVIDQKVILIGGLVAIAALLSTLIAKRLLAGLNEHWFRRLNHAAMGVAGMAMVAASTSELLASHDITLRTEFEQSGIQVDVSWPSAAFSAEWRLGDSPVIDWERCISSKDVTD